MLHYNSHPTASWSIASARRERVESVPIWAVRRRYTVESQFRTGDLDLEELRKRFKKIDKDDDDIFQCDCGSACEDGIYIVGGAPYMKQRDKFI